MRASLRTILILSLLLISAPAALAADCQALTPTVPKNAIQIDARDGTATVPRSEFGRRDQAMVYVINKNPFRYEYKTSVTTKDVPEPAIAAFFKLAGISATPPPEEPAPAEQPEAPPTEGPPGVTATPPPPPAICGTAENNHKRIGGLIDDLKKDVDDALKAQAVFTATLAPLQSSTATANQLCEKALAVIDAAPKFAPNVKKMKEALADLEKEAEKQLDTLAAARGRCNARELDDFKKRVKYVQGEFSTWATTKIDEIEDAKEAADDLAVEIGDTLKNTDAFWESRTIGPFRVPTDVNLILKRDDLAVQGEEFKQVVDVPLNFGGGQRFFLAGGIATSSADRTRYKIIDGFVDDELKKVVGVEEDSADRVAAAVLLHGIAYRPARGIVEGIGLSLGVGAAGSDDSNIQFFFGPTLSFANDHLFLTLGAFRGSEEKLADGFTVGDEVDTTKVTTLPLVERNSWSFGLGLTFRIP